MEDKSLEALREKYRMFLPEFGKRQYTDSERSRDILKDILSLIHSLRTNLDMSSNNIKLLDLCREGIEQIYSKACIDLPPTYQSDITSDKELKEYLKSLGQFNFEKVFMVSTEQVNSYINGWSDLGPITKCMIEQYMNLGYVKLNEDLKPLT